MANDIKIKITIDGKTHEVKAIKNEVNALGRSISNTDTMANALQSTLGKFTASVYALGALRDGFLGAIKSLDTLANARCCKLHKLKIKF